MSYLLSTPEVKEIWKQACNELQLELSSAVYHTWVVNNPVTAIELLEDTGATVTITSPTAFHSTNLKKNLGTQIKQKLNILLGRDVTLQFKIGTPMQQNHDNLITQSGQHVTPQSRQPHINTQQYYSDNLVLGGEKQLTPQQQKTSQLTTSHQQSTANNQSPTTSNQPSSFSPRVDDLFSESTLENASIDRAKVTAQAAGLRPDYTFETFAVSTSNEMAHAAATAVSQRPGSAYNPLFLYGGVGVGKTHLMHALAHNIIQSNPNTKVIYCTGEEFTNEIVSAIQTKKALRFKDKYRNAQVLLIDDIQFIAGKNTVQEEFFHTFNALTQQARQIVLTSDRPPHEINLLEDRLRSRFEAGLMVDIQQPSFELRTAILLIKTKAAHISISIELAKLIASRVDSARKIEGLIKRLKSAVELQNKEINSELIEAILEAEAPQEARLKLRVTPNEVIRAVANHYHIKQAALRGKRRVAEIVKARHVAMYLLKNELNLPLTEIGRWFSNRDHTTALHATRKIEDSLVDDSMLQRDISALRMSLSAVSK